MKFARLPAANPLQTRASAQQLQAASYLFMRRRNEKSHL